MKAVKQIILTGIIIVIILGLLMIILLGSNNKKTQPASLQNVKEATSSAKSETVNHNNDIVFFYGNTCQHCKDVEEWMEKNKIEQKLKIVKQEVYNNNINAQELSLAAKNCGLNTDTIGVPFLYAEGKCYIGKTDIVNYLSKRVGL